MMKRYTTWNDYLRDSYGEKVFKVPIDAGFDCPNRDGTVAHGGCTFCTVSGCLQWQGKCDPYYSMIY